MSEELSAGERWPSLELERPAVIRSLVTRVGDQEWFANFLQEMDCRDIWAIDHDEAQGGVADAEILAKLRNVFEKFASIVDVAPVELGRTLSHLTTSRCLYILQGLAERNARVLGVLGGETQMANDADTLTIASRLKMLERLSLLDKVFSAERLAEVASIMRSVHEHG